MKKWLIAVMLFVSYGTTWADTEPYSWKDWIETTEGGLVEWTILNSIAPSYFYNAFSGRSEVGATTQVFWVGKFVSADVGYSVPNAEDSNKGTVILVGNLHIDKLIEANYPDILEKIKSFIPASALKFWDALNIWLYVGHDTINSELAGGVYSSLVLKF